MKYILFFSFFLFIVFGCKSSGPGQEQLSSENNKENISSETLNKQETVEEDIIIDPVPQVACLKSCASFNGPQERSECTSKEIIAYVNEHLVYPKVAKEKGMEGLAFIRFNVEADGSTGALEVVKDPGGGCGDEALRLVREYLENSEWQAADSMGKAIPSQYMIPIRFRL